MHRPAKKPANENVHTKAKRSLATNQSKFEDKPKKGGGQRQQSICEVFLHVGQQHFWHKSASCPCGGGFATEWHKDRPHVDRAHYAQGHGEALSGAGKRSDILWFSHISG